MNPGPFLSKKERKNHMNFCKMFEFRPVRRNVDLIDLEKTLKNETLVAKIGFDTEENEPAKVFRK